MDLGIDEKSIEHELGVPVAKYALHGFPYKDILVLVRHYFEVCATTPKVVVYNIDFGSVRGEGNISANHYQLLYPYLGNHIIRSFVKHNETSWEAFRLREFIKTFRFNTSLINIALRENMHSAKRYDKKLKLLDITNYNEAKNLEIKSADIGRQLTEYKGLSYIDDAIHYLRARNTKIVFLYIPTVEMIQTPENRADFEILIKYLKQRSESDPGIILMTSLKQYENRLELFNDAYHFNSDGRRIATAELTKMLKSVALH